MKDHTKTIAYLRAKLEERMLSSKQAHKNMQKIRLRIQDDE